MDDIDKFLDEDLGLEGDITSDSLFSDEFGKAQIISKEDCIIAGLEEIKLIFKKTGASVENKFKDGDKIKKGTVIAEIIGPIRSILKGERLALNFIGKMSGIATETKNLIEKCKQKNPNIRIAATRKTTPGFRKYEKKAVKIGGGEPHRFGLFDEVMIKDNHIKVIGSIEKAIKIVKQKIKNKIVEVEIENMDDAIIAAKLNVDVIMLDNLKPIKCQEIANKIREINSSIIIEISGGINPENIVNYASFADRISLGYITHSIKNKNFSLEFI